MPNLKDIKKRIASVKNTQQITKAMKMIAAARFRKAQQEMLAARPYAEKMDQVLADLAGREAAADHPLLQSRKPRQALVVMLGSDRGLCGGFNVNLARTTEQFIKENADACEAYALMVVGRKGREQLKGRAVPPIVQDYQNPCNEETYTLAAMLGREVVERYQAERCDVVYLIYNAYRSAICQEVTVKTLLPVAPPQPEMEEPPIPPLYEPDRGALLASLLPKHVEVQLYRAILESQASEHAARMSAMDCASRSAADMIHRLTLQYNRARQTVITTELMEIISGAASIQ